MLLFDSFCSSTAKMAMKGPVLSGWGKSMKLILIIGSFLYGVSKIHCNNLCVVVVMLHILMEH